MTFFLILIRTLLTEELAEDLHCQGSKMGGLLETRTQTMDLKKVPLLTMARYMCHGMGKIAFQRPYSVGLLEHL